MHINMSVMKTETRVCLTTPAVRARMRWRWRIVGGNGGGGGGGGGGGRGVVSSCGLAA